MDQKPTCSALRYEQGQQCKHSAATQDHTLSLLGLGAGPHAQAKDRRRGLYSQIHLPWKSDVLPLNAKHLTQPEPQMLVQKDPCPKRRVAKSGHVNRNEVCCPSWPVFTV